MGVAHEDRIKHMTQGANDEADKLRREIEAAFMPRPARLQVVPVQNVVASRRQVRSWMRRNVHDYENATFLAEAANVEFELPGNGLDDETHWVWDEAQDAYRWAGIEE